MAYVEIAFPQAPHFGQSFSYAVPSGLHLEPGDAVEAPFGARELPGIVIAVNEQPAFGGELREVGQRIGDEPLLAPHQVALARWIADRYLTPLGAVVAMMLPRALRTSADLLPPARPTTAALHLRVDAGEAVRRLARARPTDAGRALRSVAALLDAGGTLPIDTLKRGFGLTPAVRELLVACGVASLAGIVHRLPPAEALRGVTGLDGTVFTPEQRAAIDAIDEAMRARFAGGDAEGAFLLHGVTGSGKTEVYIAAAQLARARGRAAIVLVPEIALTPQTVARFERVFPGTIGLLHGSLAAGKRRALWHAARSGDLDVVIGPRSALFAPFPSPGVIVLDEEHDPSFKQSDPAPRYHAREVARELARLTGAVIILGSATPDVESTLRVSTGRYRLLSLPQRVGADGSASTAPEFEVVDMAAELRSGNAHVFSRALDAGLRATLAAGEQALLFLNRRGSAPLVLCRDCGYVPRCPRCSVAYALHGDRGRLVCHHCFHSRRVPSACPKCRSVRFRPMGMGTQRLEELVRESYPGARVVRWDGDTAGTPARHEEIAQSIARREVDIVVGTQVVAKGHDFGGLTVVGVVSADLSLNIPDFRAAERTFQLLVQVGGRAGRRGNAGRVIVQTYAPDHYAVGAAATGDYEAFYRREIGFRRELAYPPCAPLTRLVLRHRSERGAELEANRYAEQLREERRRLGLSGVEVVGPAPCYFSRIAGRWRWHLLLRGSAAPELLTAAPPPRGWSIDVDPVDVL